jgi:hypothetical protein
VGPVVGCCGKILALGNPGVVDGPAVVSTPVLGYSEEEDSLWGPGGAGGGCLALGNPGVVDGASCC